MSKELANGFENPSISERAVDKANDFLLGVTEPLFHDLTHYPRRRMYEDSISEQDIEIGYGNDRLVLIANLPDYASEQRRSVDGVIDSFLVSKSPSQKQITQALISGRFPEGQLWTADKWNFRLQFSQPLNQHRRVVLDAWTIPNQLHPEKIEASGIPQGAINTDHIVFGRPKNPAIEDLHKLDAVLELLEGAAGISRSWVVSRFASRFLFRDIQPDPTE